VAKILLEGVWRGGGGYGPSQEYPGGLTLVKRATRSEVQKGGHSAGNLDIILRVPTGDVGSGFVKDQVKTMLPHAMGKDYFGGGK